MGACTNSSPAPRSATAVVMGAEPDRYVLQLGDVETPGGSKGVDQRCVIEPGRLGVHGRDGTQHRRRARRPLNRGVLGWPARRVREVCRPMVVGCTPGLVMWRMSLMPTAVVGV